MPGFSRTDRLPDQLHVTAATSRREDASRRLKRHAGRHNVYGDVHGDRAHRKRANERTRIHANQQHLCHDLRSGGQHSGERGDRVEPLERCEGLLPLELYGHSQ